MLTCEWETYNEVLNKECPEYNSVLNPDQKTPIFNRALSRKFYAVYNSRKLTQRQRIQDNSH